MVSDGFLHCCDCDSIHRITAFDKALKGALIIDGIVQTPADDWSAFMERHCGHPIESLQLTRKIPAPRSSASVSAGALYIEASNGRIRYLLRCFRKAADEPFTYHVLAGAPAESVQPRD